MARIQIIVRHDGTGWQVLTSGRKRAANQARPYASREEALSDALFSARMLNALGDDAEVMMEGSDGVHPVAEAPEAIWRKH